MKRGKINALKYRPIVVALMSLFKCCWLKKKNQIEEQYYKNSTMFIDGKLMQPVRRPTVGPITNQFDRRPDWAFASLLAASKSSIDNFQPEIVSRTNQFVSAYIPTLGCLGLGFNKLDATFHRKSCKRLQTNQQRGKRLIDTWNIVFTMYM